MHIVQDGDEVLRKTATPVAKKEFGGPELKKLLEGMARTLDAQPDGVALAAPQIGVSKRIFIVRYDRMNHASEVEESGELSSAKKIEIGVFINPTFIRRSRRKHDVEEGCLSVRGIYGTTSRHERATVKAYDEHGKLFERGGGGILAQAFQHETDHLDGILFIDHAVKTRKVHKDTDV